MPRALRSLTTLVLITNACIPVDSLEAPRDIDWVAIVPVANRHAERFGSVEPGRLYPIERLNHLVLPDRDAWILGFTTTQLRNANLPPQSWGRTVLRPSRQTEPRLPDPAWEQSVGRAGPAPAMTTDAIIRAPTVAVAGLSDVRVEKIVDGASFASWVEGYGTGEDGAPLIVLGNNSVFTLRANRAVFLGRHNAGQLRSVVWYRGQFWGTNGNTLWVGGDVSSMGQATNGGIWDGRLFVAHDRLHFVSRAGTHVWPGPNADVIDVSEESTTTIDDLRLGIDDDGAVLAAGLHWGWRLIRSGAPRRLNLRSPFARLGERLVFAVDNEVREPIDASRSRVIADENDKRPFAKIVDMVPFQGGVMLVDVGGRLSWLDEAGQAYAVFSAPPTTIGLLAKGDELFLVTQDDGQVVVYHLTPAP